MFLNIWHFLTLILAALDLGMTYCHTLELPAKMNYDAVLWTTVNQSLYREFGSFSGIFSEVGAVVAAILLSFFLRRRKPAFYWSLIGTIFLILALLVWFTFVAPMNAQFSQWPLDSIPTDWIQVRNQWEYSHLTRFFLQLIGFSALLISVFVDTPKRHFLHPTEDKV